jgi:hemerythrin-like domain-containing protein
MPQQPTLDVVRNRLQAVFAELQSADHLEPETRQALVELIDELNRALAVKPVPPEEVTRLADCTAHLAEALHHQKGEGPLRRAQDRLAEAAAAADARAPVLTGLTRQLLDGLGNMGI